MQVLTVENEYYSLSPLPDTVDDIRFAILDNTNIQEPDFFFQPLLFLESFKSPAMVLRINDNVVTIPIDWCIAVGDSMTASQIEIIPLSSINDRGFRALLFNPLTSYRLDFGKIEIIDFYNDVKWFFPKLKQNQLLAMPLSTSNNSQCIYITKDVNRNSEVILLDSLL